MLRLIFVLSAIGFSGGDVFAASAMPVPVPAAKPDTPTSGKPTEPETHEPAKASENKASENERRESRENKPRAADKKPAENADKKPADSEAADKTSAEHKPEQKSAARTRSLRWRCGLRSHRRRLPQPESRQSACHNRSRRPRTAPAPRSPAAFAMAATSTTSPLDLAAVKQAIDLVRKNRPDEATNVEGTISDPLARKLVEWVILRSDRRQRRFLALCRFHRRQSELAEHRHCCAGAPRRCCGRSASTRRPSSLSSPPNRRTPSRDISRWRARCWPRAIQRRRAATLQRDLAQ